MAEQSNPYRGTRFLVIAAALVIVVYGINQAQSVVAVFLVSVFLALIGTPPVLWLEQKRVPSFVAVIIVLAGMITLMMMIGGIVGASLNSFSDALPFYQKRLQDQILALKPLLASKHIVVTNKVLLEYFNPGPVLNLAGGLFATLSSALSNTVLILFTVTFILLEASSFPTKVRLIQNHPKASFPQFTSFVNDIKRYMVIKTLINLIGGILTAIWLYILGVDFPVLWGFLAFLLHFVPSVGSIVAAVPAVLLALVQLGGGSAALTAAGYLVIGTVLGNIVEPRIMGQKFGMSTLVVFVSLIFWGYLLGLVGALLCVPLTMSLKLACELNEETRWIAILLGPEIPPECIPAGTKRGIHLKKV